jgi:hypothetical protein
MSIHCKLRMRIAKCKVVKLRTAIAGCRTLETAAPGGYLKGTCSPRLPTTAADAPHHEHTHRYETHRYTLTVEE